RPSRCARELGVNVRLMAKRYLSRIPFCSAAKIGRLVTPGNVLTVICLASQLPPGIASAPCARATRPPDPARPIAAEPAARASNWRRVVTSRMIVSPGFIWGLEYLALVPAKAGNQHKIVPLDSRFRGNERDRRRAPTSPTQPAAHCRV